VTEPTPKEEIRSILQSMNADRRLRTANEATVRMAVIDKVLQAVGWNPVDAGLESPSGAGDYLDYELNTPAGPWMVCLWRPVITGDVERDGGREARCAPVRLKALQSGEKILVIDSRNHMLACKITKCIDHFVCGGVVKVEERGHGFRSKQRRWRWKYLHDGDGTAWARGWDTEDADALRAATVMAKG
jgi:hypothetical protein